MPSLGYLLLFSLVVVLLSPTTIYGTHGCPQRIDNCQELQSCQRDNECSTGQSCCSSGCGLRCFKIEGFVDFFKNLFPCLSGGGCGGGCSGSRCGQNSGQGSYGQGRYGAGYGQGRWWKK